MPRRWKTQISEIESETDPKQYAYQIFNEANKKYESAYDFEDVITIVKKKVKITDPDIKIEHTGKNVFKFYSISLNQPLTSAELKAKIASGNIDTTSLSVELNPVRTGQNLYKCSKIDEGELEDIRTEAPSPVLGLMEKLNDAEVKNYGSEMISAGSTGKPWYWDKNNNDIAFEVDNPIEITYVKSEATESKPRYFLEQIYFDDTRFVCIYDYDKNSKQVYGRTIRLTRGGGGGFGAARSDEVLDYIWFAKDLEHIKGEEFGYALGLDKSKCKGNFSNAAEMEQSETGGSGFKRLSIIFPGGKTYVKTNTPQDISSFPAKGSAKATLDPQSSSILYYKELVKNAIMGTDDGQVKRKLKDGRTQRVFQNATSVAVPYVPKIPDLAAAFSGFKQNGNITKTVTSSSTGEPNLPSAILFLATYDSAPIKPAKTTKGEYTSRIGGKSFLSRIGFRKKAKNMPILYSSGQRQDTATQVFKAVKTSYQKNVETYVKSWQSKRGQNEKGGVLPATAYVDYILHYANEAKKSVTSSDFAQVQQKWLELSNNNKDTSSSTSGEAIVSTAQEWCHLYGHAAGGADDYYNFVSGTHYCNTEQLAMEMGQRDVKHPNLEISVTAYRLVDTEMAVWVRYKIYYKNQKIFDHIFDGQSESFDYNEYKILQATVRMAIAKAVDKDAGTSDAIEKFNEYIRKKVAARDAKG